MTRRRYTAEISVKMQVIVEMDDDQPVGDLYTRLHGEAYNALCDDRAKVVVIDHLKSQVIT